MIEELKRIYDKYYPYNITRYVKKNKELYEWVKLNGTGTRDIEKIYSLIHPEEITIKQCGKIMPLQTVTTGYKKYCTSNCKCFNVEQSSKMFMIQHNKTKEEKKIILEKRKTTNKKRYGTEIVSQNEDIKNKIKETNLERYKVEYPMQSKEISNKVRTNWNNKTESELTVIGNKRQKTVETKYNVHHYFQSDEFKKKSKETNLEKYNIEYVTQSEDIKNKIKETNLERYNVEHPSQNEDIKQKRKSSIKSKYNSHSFNISPETSNILTNKENLEMLLKTKSPITISKELNVAHKVIYDWIHKHKLTNYITPSSSLEENELFEYLRTIYHGKIEQNIRILDGKEIDIYFPELKIGIEYNGDYWHSDGKVDKNYHLNKYNIAKTKDIKLIQIIGSIWNNEKEKIKYNLKSLFNKTIVSDYKIQKISDEVCKLFFESKQHYNYKYSNNNIGLYKDDNMIGCLSYHIEEKHIIINNYFEIVKIDIQGILNYFNEVEEFKYIIIELFNDWQLNENFLKKGFTEEILEPNKLFISKNGISLDESYDLIYYDSGKTKLTYKK